MYRFSAIKSNVSGLMPGTGTSDILQELEQAPGIALSVEGLRYSLNRPRTLAQPERRACDQLS